MAKADVEINTFYLQLKLEAIHSNCTQSCHFDAGEIFVAKSTKIDILCGATHGDFSFVEMTNRA
ncbi:hypothetical protein [Flavobacterium anhuiense]|uniref:hypothetical protein n=1 Tax=Flavobacterium anhuiense TaxID=459526 RepID=UPI003D9525B4